MRVWVFWIGRRDTAAICDKRRKKDTGCSRKVSSERDSCCCSARDHKASLLAKQRDGHSSAGHLSALLTPPRLSNHGGLGSYAPYAAYISHLLAIMLVSFISIQYWWYYEFNIQYLSIYVPTK